MSAPPRVSRCRPACRFCPGYCSAVTRTCWLTPAGPCPTSPTAPTTKFRPSLIRASAGASLNYSCKLFGTAISRYLGFGSFLMVTQLRLMLLNISSSVLRHTDYKVASPALRAVGNIVTGDDIQTQVSSGRVVCLKGGVASTQSSL